MKPILQFSHANGFPALAYRQILDPLSVNFKVRYIPTLGHRPEYPVTDNWGYLVQELIHHIEEQPEPVIGVGHSLGAVLTLFAASQRPDLFRGIVLLDPPCFNPFKSFLLWVLKQFNRQSWVTFEEQALNRRKEWPDRESALAYFQSRVFFKRFNVDVLEDYIEYGMRETDHGLSLVFDTAIESKIFSTLPHRYVSYQRSLKVPGTLLYGKHSNVVNWLDRVIIRQWTPLEVRVMKGSHLFPFEYPKETVAAIEQSISRLDFNTY